MSLRDWPKKICPAIDKSISAPCEEQGIALGSYDIWDGANHEEGMMILPPNARKKSEGLKRLRSAMISAWALNQIAFYATNVMWLSVIGSCRPWGTHRAY